MAAAAPKITREDRATPRPATASAEFVGHRDRREDLASRPSGARAPMPGPRICRKTTPATAFCSSLSEA